jgi:hypothetical protein
MGVLLGVTIATVADGTVVSLTVGVALDGGGAVKVLEGKNVGKWVGAVNVTVPVGVRVHVGVIETWTGVLDSSKVGRITIGAWVASGITEGSSVDRSG